MNYFIIQDNILNIFTKEEWTKLDLYGLNKKKSKQGINNKKTETIFEIYDFQKVQQIKNKGIITDKNGANEYIINNWVKNTYTITNEIAMQSSLTHLLSTETIKISDIGNSKSQQEELEFLFNNNVWGIEKIQNYTLFE